MKLGKYIDMHEHGWTWINDEAHLLVILKSEDIGQLMDILVELNPSENFPTGLTIRLDKKQAYLAIDLTENFEGLYFYDEILAHEPMNKKECWLCL